MIKIKQATKQGWIECCEGGVADLSYPNSKTRRGRVEDGGCIAPTITTTGGLHRIYKRGQSLMETKYRIRKLTPRETWKLMGLTFEDCDKAFDVGVSNSQLYRQAGNGMVTNCVELLFQHLYKSQYDPDFECYDEKFIREHDANFTQAVTAYDIIAEAAARERESLGKSISYCIDANYWKGTTVEQFLKKKRRQLVLD